jgi:hypothetical protein
MNSDQLSDEKIYQEIEDFLAVLESESREYIRKAHEELKKLCQEIMSEDLGTGGPDPDKCEHM